MNRLLLATMLLSSAITGADAGAHAEDFGVTVDQMLAEKSMALFGIARPLAETAAESAGEG